MHVYTLPPPKTTFDILRFMLYFLRLRYRSMYTLPPSKNISKNKSNISNVTKLAPLLQEDAQRGLRGEDLSGEHEVEGARAILHRHLRTNRY